MMKTEEQGAEDRRSRIVEGATQVFLTYGFARTTMDDIARAVDISRPALYLLFRNKADIFRAVGTALLKQSKDAARKALRQDVPLAEKLSDALEKGVFRLSYLIDDCPHGDELVDVNHDIASDVVAEWRQNLIESIAAAIDEDAARRGVRLEERGLSGRALSEMLFSMLMGMKGKGCAPEAREQAGRFISIIETVLEHAPRLNDAS